MAAAWSWAIRVSIGSCVTRPSPFFTRNSEIIAAGLAGDDWPKAGAQDAKATIAPKKTCFIICPTHCQQFSQGPRYNLSAPAGLVRSRYYERRGQCGPYVCIGHK